MIQHTIVRKIFCIYILKLDPSRAGPKYSRTTRSMLSQPMAWFPCHQAFSTHDMVCEQRGYSCLLGEYLQQHAMFQCGGMMGKKLQLDNGWKTNMPLSIALKTVLIVVVISAWMNKHNLWSGIATQSSAHTNSNSPSMPIRSWGWIFTPFCTSIVSHYQIYGYSHGF